MNSLMSHEQANDGADVEGREEICFLIRIAE